MKKLKLPYRQAGDLVQDSTHVWLARSLRERSGEVLYIGTLYARIQTVGRFYSFLGALSALDWLFTDRRIRQAGRPRCPPSVSNYRSAARETASVRSCTFVRSVFTVSNQFGCSPYVVVICHISQAWLFKTCATTVQNLSEIQLALRNCAQIIVYYIRDKYNNLFYHHFYVGLTVGTKHNL